MICNLRDQTLPLEASMSSPEYILVSEYYHNCLRISPSHNDVVYVNLLIWGARSK